MRGPDSSTVGDLGAGPAAGRGDIAVTGLGLVTPAGIGEAANWAAITAGTPTASADPALAGLPVDFSCRVPDFDPNAEFGRKAAWRLDRFAQLAMAAARQAVASAGLDPATWDGARVGVVLGNSLGGSTTFERQHGTLIEGGPDYVSPLTVPMSMVNMVAGYVAIDVRASGPSLVTATACASGSTAIGLARDLLRSGACDVVLAGGTESALSPTVMAALHNMGALSSGDGDPRTASRPFAADRNGFVAAEGAGVLVLERPADARARGARIRANLSGYAATSDAHHVTAPDPSGRSAANAVRAALADAGIPADEVAHVNAHGTATPLNDAAEARVLSGVLSHGPLVTSTKGVTGHTLAAAGAIEAAYTVLTIENGLVPPTANVTAVDERLGVNLVTGAAKSERIDVAVSNSFGFGGHNSVLVLTAA